MKSYYAKVVLLLTVVLCSSKMLFSQDYPNMVTFVSESGNNAVFTSIGAASKKGDAAMNASQSLFNTLFYIGVPGFNDGKALVQKDNREFVHNFLNNRYGFYVTSSTEMDKPSKNNMGKFQVTCKITIPVTNLFRELEINGLYERPEKKYELEDVEEMEDGTALPTIIVVPYKKEGESFESILQSDYDRRMAVSNVQAGFESKDISTIDLSAKIAAVNRRSEYTSDTEDSRDKTLLVSSGADVYVTVDMLKDVTPAGSRVSLVLKAYETSSGTIISSKDCFTDRFKTDATDMLCALAVKSNIGVFLDDICKNFNKRINTSKRVVLDISLAQGSIATMYDGVGPNNYPLYKVISNWIKANSKKFHLQGVVSESMIYDYIMMPLKDSEGYAMDAMQYAFMIQSYLTEEVGVACSSKIDGNTIYISIL